MFNLITPFYPKYDELDDNRFIGLSTDYHLLDVDNSGIDTDKHYGITLLYSKILCYIKNSNLYVSENIYNNFTTLNSCEYITNKRLEKNEDNAILRLTDRNNDKYTYLFEAFDLLAKKEDGYYALIGPTIDNNQFNLDKHILQNYHNSLLVDYTFQKDSKYSFLELEKLIREIDEEGILFWTYNDNNKIETPIAWLRKSDFLYKWHTHI